MIAVRGRSTPEEAVGNFPIVQVSPEWPIPEIRLGVTGRFHSFTELDVRRGWYDAVIWSATSLNPTLAVVRSSERVVEYRAAADRR